ncbi:MAG: rhodanese-like domain-containing protein [Chloroflexi bacterium]|nr:rhodanese-like domain-containing protein [Chloroflexota bacterium]
MTWQQDQDDDQPYVSLTTEEAKELIARGGVQVIDVREPGEYAQGHIPEAKLIPLNQVLSNPQQLLEGDNIVFVCQVGQRSAVAAEMAAAIGKEKVYNLEGGTAEWAAKGFPLAY